jgi:hypothetical protein
MTIGKKNCDKNHSLINSVLKMVYFFTPESTVRDATFRNYSPVVLQYCTAEPIGEKFTRTNKEASLLIIQSVLGWVSDSEDFIKAFEE